MAIYLRNKDLLKEIMISKEQDKLTYRAEQMFIMLANKTISKMRYYNPDDKLDCLQEGLLVLFSRWRSFDPNHPKANAFAYFTEIFKRGMAKGYNDLKDKNKKSVSLQAAGGNEGFLGLMN